jgi:hypothetical protein
MTMEDDRQVADEAQEAGETPKVYDPPVLTALGRLNDLTKGPVGVGGDLNGMVISF